MYDVLMSKYIASGKKTKKECSFELKTSTLSEISILPDSQCTGGVLKNKTHERKNSREKRCEN